MIYQSVFILIVKSVRCFFNCIGNFRSSANKLVSITVKVAMLRFDSTTVADSALDLFSLNAIPSPVYLPVKYRITINNMLTFEQLSNSLTHRITLLKERISSSKPFSKNLFRVILRSYCFCQFETDHPMDCHWCCWYHESHVKVVGCAHLNKKSFKYPVWSHFEVEKPKHNVLLISI